MPEDVYCSRLGLDPPDVDRCARGGEVKLFHLMVACLLERGRAMSLDELVARLEDAGVRAETGDLAHSLKKAWHGLDPVDRGPDGLFRLDLSSWRVRSLARQLAERTQPPPPPPEPPEVVQPPDDAPLSLEELDAAFRDRWLSSLSPLRQAAAVLDALGRPEEVGEVEAILAGFTRHRRQLRPDSPRHWHSSLVTTDAQGRLELSDDPVELARLRRAVRDLARPALVRQAEQARLDARLAAHRHRRAAQERTEAEQAALLRRAVLRVVPAPDEVEALALLDVGARDIRVLSGGEVRAAGALLERFDLVAGIGITATLVTLGLDPDRWRLADLGPPQKTRLLNRSGRKLRITPELLISGTTGISRPLGDPARVASYLASGDRGRLNRRLASDVKALYAFYRYGVLHGCVRLRWGFLDERLPADWAQPGDPSMFALVERAREEGREVEVVVNNAPGWKEPWARARRGRVVSWRAGALVLADGLDEHCLDADEVQAMRLAPA